MGRKLLGTAVVIFILSIIVLIVRDNLPLEEWKGHHELSPDGSDSEGSED